MTVNLFSNCPANFQSWSSQCVFKFPAVSHSGPECIDINPIFFTPDNAWLSNTIQSVHAIITFISKLLTIGSPLAIIRRIIAVIINTFDSGFWKGNISHIFQKTSKILPSNRQFYSSPTIIFIGWMISIFTSLAHIMPTLIQWVGRTIISFASLMSHACHYDTSNGIEQEGGVSLP